MFILVLDQNCRSNCTDQGLNREHLPVLAVVWPWRSSVTLSKSVKLPKLHFKRGRFAKIITPTHPALHFNGFKETVYTLNSVSLPTPRFPSQKGNGNQSQGVGNLNTLGLFSHLIFDSDSHNKQMVTADKACVLAVLMVINVFTALYCSRGAFTHETF